MTSYQKRRRCNGMAMDTLSKEMLLGIDTISFLKNTSSSHNIYYHKDLDKMKIAHLHLIQHNISYILT